MDIFLSEPSTRRSVLCFCITKITLGEKTKCMLHEVTAFVFRNVAGAYRSSKSCMGRGMLDANRKNDATSSIIICLANTTQGSGEIRATLSDLSGSKRGCRIVHAATRPNKTMGWYKHGFCAGITPHSTRPWLDFCGGWPIFKNDPFHSM